MDSYSDNEAEFIPASTIDEAKERIFSLTGGTSKMERGEKRALVALAKSLQIDVDIVKTNADLALEISDALDIEWLPYYEVKTKVNLSGLNALLRGAALAKEQGSLHRLDEDLPTFLKSPAWESFIPARSKIEAVNRISNLTQSGPERVGPGSKEQKSVLINLATNLAPSIDTSLSKSKLGAALADYLRVPWTPSCTSTSQSIQLEGLNTLLAGAERLLDVLGEPRAMLLGTPENEAQDLVLVLSQLWKPKIQPDGTQRIVWDGKDCIQWMIAQESSDSFKTEWPGLYWENKGIAGLNSEFACSPNPPRQRYANTPFDYALNHLWDFKAKTEYWKGPDGRLKKEGPWAPLNDVQASEEAIDDQGLGYLTVRGIATADVDRTLRNWQKQMSQEVNPVRRRTTYSNSGGKRRFKKTFEPTTIDAFYFPNPDALAQAKLSGIIKQGPQGRQPASEPGGSGAPRKDQLNLNHKKGVLSPFHCAQASWE
jgi:hypothetical protein